MTRPLFVAPSSSSSSSRAGHFFLRPFSPPLLALRVTFVFAVALVFATTATPRSVSAKVHFSETFDGTRAAIEKNQKSKRVSMLFFFLLLCLAAANDALPMRARFSSIFLFLR
jgi:predicted nucleic acid-binding Zn ribbon protein